MYDEIEDDHQVVKNILKIGPKTVEISKKGGRNSHMVFEKGKENLSYYDTPFGSLLLGVSTSDIRWMEKEDHMNLQVDYDLSINKYKKMEYVPVEYPPTAQIMADLHELEMEITAGLAELEEML